MTQLRIMTFMARDQTMWRLLMDPGQDPFTQLAAQWHGLLQSQVLVLLPCVAVCCISCSGLGSLVIGQLCHRLPETLSCSKLR